MSAVATKNKTRWLLNKSMPVCVCVYVWEKMFGILLHLKKSPHNDLLFQSTYEHLDFTPISTSLREMNEQNLLEAVNYEFYISIVI